VDDGLVTLISRRAVKDLADALVEAVGKAGMTVFARVDYAAHAEAAGQSLRPTELVLFGNPANGVVLLQDEQTVGVDLPMRALAWEDENGESWLTYPDLAWIARRHDLGARSAEIMHKLETSFAGLARSVTGN
jgi:uncharacterized protein (DUF302 family)